MDTAVTLIFPHQLFKDHPALKQGREVYLVEEWLFFRQYNFHKKKLVLHRASMKFYAAWLQQQGYAVNYIESQDKENDCRELIATLAKRKITEVHIAAPADDWLIKRLTKACNDNGLSLNLYDTPNFLNTPKSVDPFFEKRKTYFQTDFYKWQRKGRGILLDGAGDPVGGHWSFDADNRKKFPKKEKAPALKLPPENEYVKEAVGYVEKHFANNYGSIGGPNLFVVTFDDAERWLHDFLTNRFEKFGIYEDAIVAEEHVLHHSVLTPMFNIGLLTPLQIIEAALAAARKHNTPLNSVEGFLRQIMGWREFIHIVYEREGVRQRTTNYWRFKRKIPKSFWTGETGIVPIDITIKKLLKVGYCHHIERLMVLGSFMQLCEFDPDEVYRWFMEMFIDAYDWVMVPNVYGMTQFADGGLMTTKPYISGSNYLMKMSDYPKGDWQATWDGLFWRFMHVHRGFFLTNPRLGMLINTYDKMEPKKQRQHLNNAERFLDELDEN
ncbi:cryptochrome/photolyase family protein [Mucilaginibacter auburnensis]|uniref:Deoxyribodipyrimidine photolyase-related protein n=1 Tax=Mucilaginibacter auburnensis TaxID=1457233 RepID=A0A2H9VPD4_9SPHI|nr:cryptochrome/photolyase family protein [Mucilaginibacter auburnensis]PJJ80183.1 deoxyribodipyrimidine photolyase-related protein [Mucilaginibacter auburnensis]